YIGNIPSRYRARDLRRFFATSVESGAFACFHFRHRPQRIAAAASTSGAASSGKKAPRLLCCYARASSPQAANEVMRLHSGSQWRAYSGVRELPLGLRCLISVCDSASAAVPARVAADLRSLTGPQLARALKRHGLQVGASGRPQPVELCPPACMPQGNVGTPTSHFLGLVQRCQLPAGLIASLGLDLRSAGKRRGKFSAVPFDYGGAVRSFSTSAPPRVDLDEEDSDVAENHLRPDTADEEAGQAAGGTDDEEEAEEEDEPAEDWERFEALHDDPHNVDRWKERKYEEPLEIVWEKGGPGLVWYTDEQFWRQGEKLELFDDPTNYDWDLDMSAYEAAGDAAPGDADARDLLDMRRFGAFERHTRGFGSDLLRRQGWAGPGSAVGGSGSGGGGLTEPLSAEPRPSRAGFGYRGPALLPRGHPTSTDKFNSNGLTRREAALVARARATGAYVAAAHDRPAVRAAVDPGDSLLVRANPDRLKYRPAAEAASAAAHAGGRGAGSSK
ncbi:hypothetical protein BOX15_Mlig033373g1, partial [Macrostomum lignano]